MGALRQTPNGWRHDRHPFSIRILRLDDTHWLWWVLRLAEQDARLVALEIAPTALAARERALRYVPTGPPAEAASTAKSPR